MSLGDAALSLCFARCPKTKYLGHTHGHRTGPRLPTFTHFANRADETREAAIGSLIARGILERREDRFLWVFRLRRYPLVDGKAEREVKLRIMEVLFSDMVPTPRDTDC